MRVHAHIDPQRPCTSLCSCSAHTVRGGVHSESQNGDGAPKSQLRTTNADAQRSAGGGAHSKNGRSALGPSNQPLACTRKTATARQSPSSNHQRRRPAQRQRHAFSTTPPPCAFSTAPTPYAFSTTRPRALRVFDDAPALHALDGAHPVRVFDNAPPRPAGVLVEVL
ncbi:hypothetical protein PLICRDRAFT_174019 [Plicaturopsis crispa FD-325 SS-3]|nr:hypothetical protein PLICRDRAFT_174019 [Plicaturopsis crispa FD-325 SS-3]